MVAGATHGVASAHPVAPATRRRWTGSRRRPGPGLGPGGGTPPAPTDERIDRLFERTCDVIGRPELATDERFATNAARVRHRDELIPILSEVFARRPSVEWLAAFEEASVPCAPVRTLDEVFASPEGAATIQSVDDPERGSLRLVADPIRVDGRVPPARKPPPRLGEHTDEVRSELER